MELPENITDEGRIRCLKMLSDATSEKSGGARIMTGNLPALLTLTPAFREIQIATQNENVPHVWYSAGESFQLKASYVKETEMGRLVCLRLGLFRQKQ
jgi:hypothetical protein